ncbi:hypothetical protein OG792_02610 [Micromonospora sp. NBC_01699]|uniref:hypothetical protein n=1 Tax=Micromonospora sp. NBC_01699 TaxID=2975984 RepID=UPI002E2E84DE|nr:hypothetical protein [Micromonospora sp. NBC_01699]
MSSVVGSESVATDGESVVGSGSVATDGESVVGSGSVATDGESVVGSGSVATDGESVVGSVATDAELEPPPPPAAERGTARTALFVGGLILALVGGFGLGRLNTDAGGSSGGAPAGVSAGDHTHAPGTGAHEHGPATTTTGGTTTTGTEVGGLSLSASGFTLVPTTGTFQAGRAQPFQFRVLGADRRPVTGFTVVHDKPLHLVVARRDLSGYQHLHPTMSPDGTWTVPLTLPTPGIWRAYADFTAPDATGKQTAATLGVDLVVAGDYAPVALPAAAREANVGEFTVTYEGTPQVGVTQPLLFRVFANGSPVAGLERYLGAYGHLVALRAGDLGYVHVHPEEELVGGAVKFWVAAPSPGSYRLFFDFQVAGVVRTAEFTLIVA